jgi:hypothetical protein
MARRKRSKIAPLKTSFLITSMIGFLVSALYIPRFSLTWAFTFGVVFTIMFVASMISMVKGEPGEQLLVRPKPIK